MMNAANSAVAPLVRGGFPLLVTGAANPYAATGKWILGVAGMVVGMIHVGGVTRLTQSGLSMTDWSVTGSLPPLSVQDWETEFARYKTYPEWQQRQQMTLSEFQYIYAWEYGHRMFGRFIGVAFIVPWIYFTARRQIPTGYQGRMALLGTMGASQGVVGWWMVQSGLTEDRRGEKKEIRVKPIRLATHLTMAVATYSTLLWTGLDLLTLPHHHQQQSTNGAGVTSSSNPAPKVAKSLHMQDMVHHASRIRWGGIAVLGLTGVTIVSGALVAGNDAGRAYNTFPTMNGEWIPSDMYILSPWSRNLTENTATVQWNHRVLGTVTATTALLVAAFGLRRPQLLTVQTRNGLLAIGITATTQFTLGVTTLLQYVPITLAAAHQLGSIALLSSGLYLVHSARLLCRPSVLKAIMK